MNKPRDYDEARVTIRNITYQFEDGASMMGGVLGKGQVVWIKRCRTCAPSISAYVRGLGLVTVDSRSLIRTIDPHSVIDADETMSHLEEEPVNARATYLAGALAGQKV